jgi:hypothetical protein
MNKEDWKQKVRDLVGYQYIPDKQLEELYRTNYSCSDAASLMRSYMGLRRING